MHNMSGDLLNKVVILVNRKHFDESTILNEGHQSRMNLMPYIQIYLEACARP